MAIQVTRKPEFQTFTLTAVDPDGETKVSVRQATEGDNIGRSDLFASSERVFDDKEVGEVRIRQNYNSRAIRRYEAYCTLGEVMGIVDENGEPVFRSALGADGLRVSNAMTKTEFNAAWNLLPMSVAEEISKAIYKVNIQWDPNRPGE